MAVVGNTRGCGFGEEMGSEGHRCSQRRCVFGEFVNKARHLGAERGGEIDGSEAAPSRVTHGWEDLKSLICYGVFGYAEKGFISKWRMATAGCESLEQERGDDVVW
ncbi:hypothetical protein ACFX2H_038448 [Malus domestica]